MALVLAKSFTLFLMMSMPRSSEAFSSRMFALHSSPKSCFAVTSARLVFPVPAGPANIR